MIENEMMMTTIPILEIIIVILAIFVAIILYKILKNITEMMINAIVGIIILFIANVLFTLDIPFNWITILICAFAGAIGAILIILLNLLGIAFT